MKSVAFPDSYLATDWGVGQKFPPETCLAKAGLANYTHHTCSKNSIGEPVAVSVPETQILFRHQKRKYPAISYSKARQTHTFKNFLIKVMDLKPIRFNI